MNLIQTVLIYLLVTLFNIKLVLCNTNTNNMKPVITNLLQKIYNASPKNIFSIQVTGGGIDALKQLFTTPGASNSLINAGIPYSRAALSHTINSNTLINSNTCSREMAIQLGMYYNNYDYDCYYDIDYDCNYDNAFLV